MKVQWTDNAVGHLVNIYEYIALNSPIYAKQMVDKITHRSLQIAEHPDMAEKYPNMTAMLSGN
jgi:plasmid stabilization system protein ParE